MNIKKIFALMLGVVFLFSACQKGGDTSQSSDISLESVPDSSKESEASSEKIDISTEEVTEKIASIHPAVTEIILELGLVDRIVAVDSVSKDSHKAELGEAVSFDMLSPDMELIIDSEPDIVFVTAMTAQGGDDPYVVLRDMGMYIVEIPISNSIDEIKENIINVGDYLEKKEEAQGIVEKMEADIAEVQKIGDTIENKKIVLFELAPMPNIYSFGKGVYLNEMLEIIGAENALGKYESWMPVEEEIVLELDPDVILTSASYVENPVEEILGRSGWESVKAVDNKEVYLIDPNSSSQPNQNIVKAIKEMAKAIYPEYYN